ncbi:hypothetical protein ACIP6V_05875 [Streptomyces sp. NPDC088770]|uniref:hypothetical protein n=1 Tax=unclassified Streptomyces TaxID=2593676 RepID=UPI003826F0B4
MALAACAVAGHVIGRLLPRPPLDACLDPGRRVPIVASAPLLAASVIAAGLHSASDELHRTAVRPWWPWRLAHLLGLTAVAAAPLPTAVLGDALSYGPPTMIRNTLGCTGVTAAAAVLLGARLSRLPAFGYVGAVYLASGGARGRGVTVWAWPMQQAAWAAALAAFAVGGALHAACGSRPNGPRASTDGISGTRCRDVRLRRAVGAGRRHPGRGA